MWAVLAALLAIFGTAFSRLLADDIKAWIPTLVELLIGVAVKHLPREKQDRYREEWRGDAFDTPGDLSKLVRAIGFLRASLAMGGAGSVMAGSLMVDGVIGAIDLSFSAILLSVTFPLMLTIALAVKLDGGPIFLPHRRVGQSGRYFHLLTFRTIALDADRVLQAAVAADPALVVEWIETGKLRRDPRFTSVGLFLRRLGLNELPQLINILRREMSLVGPRPITNREVPLYGHDIAHYYSIRPGLISPWPLNESSNTPYARRMQLVRWAKQRSIRTYIAALARMFNRY